VVKRQKMRNGFSKKGSTLVESLLAVSGQARKRQEKESKCCVPKYKILKI
jgi:hypothetical protein